MEKEPLSCSHFASLHSFEELGFAILPDVFNADEFSIVLSRLGGLDDRRGRAGVRHILSRQAVKAIATDTRLLGIAQVILGECALPFRATLFDKSPDSNWLVAWHQDTALPLREKRETPGWGPWSVKQGVICSHAPASALGQVLALRLHLDDCTADNGPLRVLPATHGLGVLGATELERRAAEGQSIECNVRKGGVLAMRPLLIHASSKSKSSASRRVLHIEYASSLQIGESLQLAIA